MKNQNLSSKEIAEIAEINQLMQLDENFFDDFSINPTDTINEKESTVECQITSQDAKNASRITEIDETNKIMMMDVNFFDDFGSSSKLPTKMRLIKPSRDNSSIKKMPKSSSRQIKVMGFHFLSKDEDDNWWLFDNRKRH